MAGNEIFRLIVNNTCVHLEKYGNKIIDSIQSGIASQCTILYYMGNEKMQAMPYSMA